MARPLLLLLFACSLFAANVRLYLKDGGHHLVREYRVEGDRVRFYSVERREWEEMPVALVDLKKTEGEIARNKADLKQEAEILEAEDKAERAMEAEISRVPVNPGVYLVNGDQLQTIKHAESKVVNNKRRSVLKVLTPIPVVTGKGTVELDGTQSANVVPSATPEFYIRLSQEQRFGIIRLTPTKNARVVEKLTVIPVSGEIIEEQQTVEIFRRQVDEGLYKIWPMKPLEPGEYAVVEYTDGKVNLQIWDFAYRPGK